MPSCSVIGYWVHFPSFIPQMPLAHPDDPLNGEFGKVSSLEESHEDPAEDGHGAPGIRSHDLFERKAKLQADTLTSTMMRTKRSRGGTHQSDFLHVWIPPFKDSEEELIGSL